MTQPAPRQPARAMTPGELAAALQPVTIIRGPDRESYGLEGLLATCAENLERLHREALRARELAALMAVERARAKGHTPGQLGAALEQISGIPVAHERAAALLRMGRAVGIGRRAEPAPTATPATP